MAWPEPVAHVHSNGEFCADRQITAGAMPGNLWPISLYTEEQVRELLASHGVGAAAAPSKEDDRA